MNRIFEIQSPAGNHKVRLEVGNYTPRRNEFERGLKYELHYADGEYGKTGTGYRFSTIKDAKEFAKREWIRFV